MSASTYLQNAVLNYLRGQSFPDVINGTYVGLFDGDPTAAGTGGEEITADIRSAGRPAITFGAITEDGIANNAEVEFGLAEADAEASHFGVFDAVSAGNLLVYGPIRDEDGDATTIIIGTDNAVSLPVGALPIAFTETA